MIHDTKENALLYLGISKNLDTAFNYIASTDFTGMDMDERTIKIDGDRVYAMIQRYETEGTESRAFEAHRRYMDVQLLVSGYETMIVRNLHGLTEEICYSGEKDVALYGLTPARTGSAPRLPFGGGTELRMKPGDYAVFFPHDAHVPKIMSEKPNEVLKVVVKVMA